MALIQARLGDALTILPSAARTATPTIDQYTTEHGSPMGGVFIIDCTAIAATPSVVFTILGYDPVSTKTWVILASAAVTAVSTTVLRVHPELTASANLIAKDLMPDYFTFTAVHGDADSITYSLSAQLV